MKLDLSCGRLNISVSPLRELALAHLGGFDSVEPNRALLFSSAGTRFDWARQCTALGLEVGPGTLPIDYQCTEALFRTELTRLDRAADAAEELGCASLCTYLPPLLARDGPLPNIQALEARLSRILAILSGRIRLALEFVSPPRTLRMRDYYTRGSRGPIDSGITNFEGCVGLCERLGQLETALVLDSWHWSMAGEKDGQRLPSDTVVAVEVSDLHPTARSSQQDIWQRTLAGASPRMDYSGFARLCSEARKKPVLRAEVYEPIANEQPELYVKRVRLSLHSWKLRFLNG